MLIINKDILHEMYIGRGMTDKEIAFDLNVDRTTVSKLRKKYEITTRKYTGFIGEDIVKDKLNEMGISFQDMNDISKDYIYDLNVSGLRVEVKSAKVNRKNMFHFVLTEKKSNGNVASENRLLLKNGKTKKIFRKTCDLFIFVCVGKNGDNSFYLIPSKDLDDERQCLALTPNSQISKFDTYKDRWDLLTAKGGGK